MLHEGYFFFDMLVSFDSNVLYLLKADILIDKQKIHLFQQIQHDSVDTYDHKQM